MSDSSDPTRSVKPRVAKGAVIRAERVEVPIYLANGQVVLARISKAEALRALRRAKSSVDVCIPFGDGCLILG